MKAAKTELVPYRKKKTSGKNLKGGQGASKMREAADAIVGRDCQPLVEALATNAKKGQMMSAKFLYDLARTAEGSDEGDGQREFRSMALEIINSPEWSGEAALENPGEDEEEG